MKFKLAPNQDEKKEFVLAIQNYFDDSIQSIHKARNEIKIIEHKGIKYVIKSFKIPHIINKTVYTFFRSSKAKKSFENALKIENFTPKPIGYIEFFKMGLLDKSYYISEKYDYNFTIREVLSDKKFPNKENILKEFTEFAYKLHNQQIIHEDFSPGNILIKKIDLNYEFKIVDINRMRFKHLDTLSRAKNFSKLWATDEDLSIISYQYAKLINLNEEDFFQKALLCSNRHKNKNEFYKKIKGRL